eukprot:IDg12811t1
MFLRCCTDAALEALVGAERTMHSQGCSAGHDRIPAAFWIHDLVLYCTCARQSRKFWLLLRDGACATAVHRLRQIAPTYASAHLIKDGAGLTKNACHRNWHGCATASESGALYYTQVRSLQTLCFSTRMFVYLSLSSLHHSTTHWRRVTRMIRRQTPAPLHAALQRTAVQRQTCHRDTCPAAQVPLQYMRSRRKTGLPDSGQCRVPDALARALCIPISISVHPISNLERRCAEARLASAQRPSSRGRKRASVTQPKMDTSAAEAFLKGALNSATREGCAGHYALIRSIVPGTAQYQCSVFWTWLFADIFACIPYLTSAPLSCAVFTSAVKIMFTPTGSSCSLIICTP